MTRIQGTRRYTLLTMTLALIVAIRVSGPDQARAHAMERLREQRLIDRSVPLFQTVAPTVPRQTIAIEYLTSDYFSIASQDPAGNDVATVIWDVHRDEVCEVTHNPAPAGSRGKALLSGSQVVQKTRSWLKSLELVPNIEQWSPTRAPISLRSHRWVVCWSGAGRRAIVQVDDRSGALYEAMVRTR